MPQVLVTHLTRMRPGYICVAGLSGGQHVRPVLGFPGIPRAMAEGSGPFRIAERVDFRKLVPSGGAPPEVEDHFFEPSGVARVGTVGESEFADALRQVAKRKLATIFGPDLVALGPGAVVERGRGLASLGVLQPATKPELRIRAVGAGKQVRLRFTDGIFGLLDCSVTDLRLWNTDQASPNAAAVNDLRALLESGKPVLLCVGLGRSWAKPGGESPKHWLQVNNIHMV